MIRTEVLEGGAVTRIVLNRPKANILDRAMIEAIGGALSDVVTPSTKLLLFAGAGEHFSFGASVAEHRREEAPAMLAAFHGLFHRLLSVGLPTCALVQGKCLGGGLELAAFCTYVVATPEAQLGQPEIRLGVFPPLASVLLPWRCGGQQALDLCVSGSIVDATEAQKRSLINAVSPDLESYWRELYQTKIAPSSASSLRFAEKAVRYSLAARIFNDLPAIEKFYLEELMNTHDANEGINAFLERRPPRFLV